MMASAAEPCPHYEAESELRRIAGLLTGAHELLMGSETCPRVTGDNGQGLPDEYEIGAAGQLVFTALREVHHAIQMLDERLPKIIAKHAERAEKTTANKIVRRPKRAGDRPRSNDSGRLGKKSERQVITPSEKRKAVGK